VLGEIECPVCFDELIAVIELEPLEGCQRAVVSSNAVGPDQHQQVGSFRAFACRDAAPGADSAGDLRANFGVGHGLALDGRAFWVEDQSILLALDVERPAIVAQTPAIRHDRVVRPGVLTRCIQSGQGLFEVNQLRGKIRQLFLGSHGFIGSSSKLGLSFV
jgi:hypothetical protein